MDGAWDAHWQAPRAGLKAENPIEASGNTRRPAPVTADGEARHARRHGDSGAAAGGAGDTGGIPGVVCLARQQGLGAGEGGEFRSLCLAENNSAGGAQAFHQNLIAIGNMILVDHGSLGRAKALGVVKILDRNGQAVERTQAVAPHHRRFGGLGLGAGTVVVDGNVGVEGRLQLLDALEKVIDHFDGGYSPGGDQVSQLDTRHPGNIIGPGARFCRQGAPRRGHSRGCQGRFQQGSSRHARGVLIAH